MTSNADLAARFQAARPHLGALAYRMLGSVDDSEDAVQDAWLRLTGTEHRDARQIANLDAWLTTVVARICLNTLRTRRARARRCGFDASRSRSPPGCSRSTAWRKFAPSPLPQTCRKRIGIGLRILVKAGVQHQMSFHA